ncbi:MAG TPA: alanine--glyoxylate aminotransferase family protein [Polyangiaceae bacterium]|nr:alanine--glyoxylate aminotransferase family protein [Polyangiaceae bacterium]
MRDDPMTTIPAPLSPPARILLGPGPSDVAPSVRAALGAPTVGHLDPYFLTIMDEVSAMLRVVLGTKNRLTFPISGTGSAGMEACLVNVIEPGDRVLVPLNGAFGARLAEIAERAGAEVTRVPGDWGRPIAPEAMTQAAGGKKYKVVCVVHGETSTGVLQDLAPIRELADSLGALLLVDAVTTLGGVAVDMDSVGIDVLYSGTQKCLSCPPGLSPVSFSERAEDAMSARKSRVQSWYLDVSLIKSYWGTDRVYHHTAPINMMYGLHEALRLVLEEGLATRFRRHATNAKALAAGLVALGLSPRVREGERLPPLTTVAIPEDVDDAATRRALLERYGIEIGGGLGPFKGNTWRVGLMGAGSTRRNVLLCLTALADTLQKHSGAKAGEAIAAAHAALGSPS